MSERCCVCGENSVVRFPKVTDAITHEHFAVWRCEGCGLGVTVPRPDDLSRYYGTRYYGNRHGLTARYCIRRRLRFIASSKTPSGAKLLDVGCGDGSFLLAAQDTGWDVTGVDIQPEDARNAGVDAYETIDQVFDKAPFDCITLWHSLEHMTDPTATLRGLSTLLKPEGHLFVAVPCNSSFQARVFRQHWIPLDVPRHLIHFDLKSLRLCLEKAGLSIQRKWHTEIEYDLIGWSQSALNVCFSDPNVFIDLLAGKKRQVSRMTGMIHLTLGFILTAVALPLALAETWFQRGGTLVVKTKSTQQ